ncbi:unnamed protein product [Closterium sp. NIES-54]
MEHSSAGDNTEPANTTPNTSSQSPHAEPPLPLDLPEAKESRIAAQTLANTQPSTATTVTPADWRVYQIPSPTASYDADDDYSIGADMDNVATLGEVEEEQTEQETAPTSATTPPSRRSTGRTLPRWTPEEECEVLAAFITRQAQIRARTRQQGRSWYPLIQEELLEQNPRWRHDVAALKAKYNRMKEQWRKINDRSKRSGAGCATGLPAWYHLGKTLWGERPSTIPPVLVGTGLNRRGGGGRTVRTSSTATPTATAPTTTVVRRSAAVTTIPSSDTSTAAAIAVSAHPTNPLPLPATFPPTAEPETTSTAADTSAPTNGPVSSATLNPSSPSRAPPPVGDTPSRRGPLSPLSPDTIPLASPTSGPRDSGATTGVSIRSRRQIWGARPATNGKEGCSRNAWYQYPRKPSDGKDGQRGRGGTKGIGRNSAGRPKSASTAELVRELHEHNDKRQDEKWEKFESLTREVLRSFGDEQRSRRRRSPQSTSSSEDEA